MPQEEEKQEQTPIWEGPIGNSGYGSKIESVGQNMHRGILKIIDTSNNEIKYQIEVKIDRMNPWGGNETHVAEWSRIIKTWVNNNL